jgi:hypothetical protein
LGRDPEVFDRLLIQFYLEENHYYAQVYDRFLCTKGGRRSFYDKMLLEATLLGYLNEDKREIIACGEVLTDLLKEDSLSQTEIYYQWLGDLFLYKDNQFLVFNPTDTKPDEASLIGGLEILWDVRLNEIIGTDILDQETLAELNASG